MFHATVRRPSFCLKADFGMACDWELEDRRYTPVNRGQHLNDWDMALLSPRDHIGTYAGTQRGALESDVQALSQAQYIEDTKQMHHYTGTLPQLLAMANTPFCTYNMQSNIAEALVPHLLRGDDVQSRTLDLLGALQLAHRLRHPRLIDLVECVCVQRLESGAADLAAELCDAKRCMPVEFENMAQWKEALEERAGRFIRSLDAFERQMVDLRVLIELARDVRADI
ncbi:hypothetical protein DFH07DRAFT_809117 [Mycena maculata]|uniref:Uncharacterized protein n=1 Tax=Mycena maculata TaxID=230809 RepID=A0AAD7JK09_9AGAR|nr:hypothetical protein DFH07DRAFT_809117 [Mycena maculata]